MILTTKINIKWVVVAGDERALQFCDAEVTNLWIAHVF